jgi:hypothetical protein
MSGPVTPYMVMPSPLSGIVRQGADFGNFLRLSHMGVVTAAELLEGHFGVELPTRLRHR